MPQYTGIVTQDDLVDVYRRISEVEQNDSTKKEMCELVKRLEALEQDFKILRDTVLCGVIDYSLGSKPEEDTDDKSNSGDDVKSKGYYRILGNDGVPCTVFINEDNILEVCPELNIDDMFDSGDGVLVEVDRNAPLRVSVGDNGIMIELVRLKKVDNNSELKVDDPVIVWDDFNGTSLCKSYFKRWNEDGKIVTSRYKTNDWYDKEPDCSWSNYRIPTEEELRTGVIDE